MDDFKWSSQIAPTLTPGSRAVGFMRESSTVLRFGQVEVMAGSDGNFHIFIRDFIQNKLPDDSPRVEHGTLLALTPEAWGHLCAAPGPQSKAGRED